MSYALRPTSYVLCPMPYVLRPTSYVLCPKSYVLCRMSYVLCPYLMWSKLVQSGPKWANVDPRAYRSALFECQTLTDSKY